MRKGAKKFEKRVETGLSKVGKMLAKAKKRLTVLNLFGQWLQRGWEGFGFGGFRRVVKGCQVLLGVGEVVEDWAGLNGTHKACKGFNVPESVWK